VAAKYLVSIDDTRYGLNKLREPASSLDGQPEKGTAQFIIPTGIDLGRVKSGIQYWFRERVIPSLIYFPTSKEWMSDKAYQKRVSKVMAWLKRLVKDGGLNLKSEVHEIQNIDDHRQGFKYLLTKMKEMRAADPDSTIYIDTTSAPKTWLIAAMSVVPFFSRVTLYHVKSGITPNDYSEKQINDKGGETDTINLGLAENRVLTDLVRRSGSRSVLSKHFARRPRISLHLSIQKSSSEF
jgi:hypothetical protein